MPKFFFLAVLILSFTLGVFGQPPAAAVTAPKAVPVAAAAEISAFEWSTLALALKTEDWNKSVTLSGEHLKRLRSENEQKQLAQLRYIYLFSLAGKILALNAQQNALEAEKAWTELDRAIESFVGREIVMPPRQFDTSCAGKLNFICQVKDNPRAYRTTATNKEGSGIHSFDYVLFDHPVDIKEFRGKEVFLGGILRRAEFNNDKAKPWVMRLFLNRGFVRIVVR